MCAKKLSSKELPPKQATLEEVLKDPAVDDEHAIRALRTTMSWRDWLRNDFLRYCYIVFAFAIDILISLEIGKDFNVHDPTGSFALIVLFVVGLAAAYLGYRALWPDGILTGRSKEF
jgi:hypothetical protein